MALCDSHSGSHWLTLWLSGIFWPSLAHYCSLILRIQSLIGSQRRCHADALSPALHVRLVHPLIKLQHWQVRTCWVGQRPLSAICWPCWPYWPCMSQATFRHLLTMLAFFDITFITTAAISFSLPQLSTYWKVHDMSKQWWRFWVTIFLMLDTQSGQNAIFGSTLNNFSWGFCPTLISWHLYIFRKSQMNYGPKPNENFWPDFF